MKLLERFTRRRHAPLWISLILSALILGAYSPVFRADFVNFDDPIFITRNPHVLAGLTRESTRWAFEAGLLNGRADDVWLPLTSLSRILVVELFGLDAGAHHAVNLLLHLLNSLLLFTFLRKTTGSLLRSALVAAIFGLHPIQVEAVAWVSQLKAVLSAFFFLLALLAYAAHAHRPGWKSYAALLAAYAAALLAKQIVVTLPVILLLLDYWPLARLNPVSVRSWKARLKEKIPLFLMAAAYTGIFIYRGLDENSFFYTPLPMGLRLGAAPYFYWAYLGKTLWPAGLAFFFPHPGWLPLWESLLAILALLGAAAAALALGKTRRFVIVGWLWYLVSLLPVIVPPGAHGIACRYMYLTLVGPAILLVWGVHDVLKRPLRKRAGITGAAAAGLILAMTAASRTQAGIWRNSDSLFKYALLHTTNNHVAHRGLGIERLKEGRLDLAENHFEAALRIMPTDDATLNRLASIYMITGRLDLADAVLKAATDLKPRDSQIRDNVGILRTHQNRLNEALGEFREAVRLDPLNAKAHFNLGIALSALGRRREAARSFLRVLKIRPNNRQARDQLEKLMVRRGP